MKTLAAVKTWEKTKVQFLVRHKSGRYYARLFQNGKETWKSLKTDHLSIAQARLAELLKEHRGRKGKQIVPANAKMTFADAAELDQQKLDEELALKRRTRKYYREVLAALRIRQPVRSALRARTPTIRAGCREPGREILRAPARHGELES